MTAEIGEFWKRWEGLVADAYPLRQFLHGSEDSAVFLSENAGLRAAVKLVKADPRSADLQLSRWQQAARLSHPHLVRLFASGRCQLDGIPLLYVATEYADEDLSQVLPNRPLTEDETRDVLEPALSALGYLHREKFVHGHLKPANIMAVDDRLKLSSDGLCRSGEFEEHAAKAGFHDPPEIDTAGASPPETCGRSE